MRILVAPDKFAGTLTAVEAAEAIAAGWREAAPDDELDLAPMSDGGPGFVDVLHEALGGELLAVTVRGPHGTPTPATVLVVGDTAYVESAQACGLHLTEEKGAESATTYGVGELVAAAIDAGATTVVVGLGGSGTNDGGAGLLAALGATADVPLDAGGAGLDGVTTVDVLGRSGAGRPGAAGRGQRRGQPADRAVRRHQDVRSAEGHHRGAAPDRRRLAGAVRRRAGPPDRVGEGRRSGRRPRLRAAGARRHPRTRYRPGRGGRRPGRAGAGGRPGRHGRGRLRLLQPGREGAARRRHRSPRRRCGRAWCWPARC